MRRALLSGFVYFILIFALGTIFGVIRTLIVSPLTGNITAVLIEIPIILIAAWFACHFAIHRFKVSASISDRLTMGIFAFVCLMAGEMILAVFLEERGVIGFFQKFHLPETRIGLGGQIAFALFPIIQRYKI